VAVTLLMKGGTTVDAIVDGDEAISTRGDALANRMQLHANPFDLFAPSSFPETPLLVNQQYQERQLNSVGWDCCNVLHISLNSDRYNRSGVPITSSLLIGSSDVNYRTGAWKHFSAAGSGEQQLRDRQ
jgi:hypothetical protein